MQLSKIEGISAAVGLIVVFVTIIAFFVNLNGNVNMLLGKEDKREKQVKEFKKLLDIKIKELSKKEKELIKLQVLLTGKFAVKKLRNSNVLLDKAISAYKVEEKKRENASYYSIIEKLNSVIEYKPDSHEAYYYLSKSHRKNGDKNSALEYINKAIKLKSEEYDYLYEKGLQYENTRRWNDAIAFYKKAEITSNSNSSIYNRLSYCYKNLGNYELSLQYVNKYISLSNGHYYGLYLRGLTHLHFKKYKDAINDFEENIRLEKISGYTDAYTKYSKKYIIEAKQKLSNK